MQRIRGYTVSVLSVLAVLAVGAMAQSLVSGDVVGTITDQSGAVVPNATVTLTNNGTGQTETATANSMYRFSLLPPGGYTVNVSASGFHKTSHRHCFEQYSTVRTSLLTVNL